MVGLTPATSGTATDRRPPVHRPAQPRHRGRRPPRRLGPARRPHRPRDPHPRPAHHGPAPDAGSTEMLDLVSLTDDEADRRVRDYSLGMRQRLGIGTALLGDPQVLDPRRAGQRARPGRHPLDARPAARLRRPRRHRAALLAPAARDRGHRRRPRRHRQRPDRRPGHQGRPARLGRHRRPRPRHRGARRRPWSAPASPSRPTPTAACTPTPHPTRSARSPSPRGLALTELRAADGAGLEEMFLELTADTQREGAAA